MRQAYVHQICMDLDGRFFWHTVNIRSYPMVSYGHSKTKTDLGDGFLAGLVR